MTNKYIMHHVQGYNSSLLYTTAYLDNKDQHFTHTWEAPVWLLDVLAFIVPDEGYYRNASCALNLISTFLSLRGCVQAHNTILTPPLFIGVPLQSQNYHRSYTCALVISIVPVSTVYRFVFGTHVTVRVLLFLILLLVLLF